MSIKSFLYPALLLPALLAGCDVDVTEQPNGATTVDVDPPAPTTVHVDPAPEPKRVDVDVDTGRDGAGVDVDVAPRNP